MNKKSIREIALAIAKMSEVSERRNAVREIMPVVFANATCKFNPIEFERLANVPVVIY